MTEVEEKDKERRKGLEPYLADWVGKQVVVLGWDRRLHFGSCPRLLWLRDIAGVKPSLLQQRGRSESQELGTRQKIASNFRC